MTIKRKELTKLKKQELGELYDLAWTQFKEDRDAVHELYMDLRQEISGNAGGYAISGDTLGKYAELMLKQTSQIVDLIKIAQKEESKETSLTVEDFDLINKEIEKKKKK